MSPQRVVDDVTRRQLDREERQEPRRDVARDLQNDGRRADQQGTDILREKLVEETNQDECRLVRQGRRRRKVQRAPSPTSTASPRGIGDYSTQS